jgi:4-carboxymuconolactone decarboxylase
VIVPCVSLRSIHFLPQIQAHETHYRASTADFAKIADGSPDLGEILLYYGAVFADGALTAREKSLIAGGGTPSSVPIIDAYTQDPEKGADFEQMTEALHVAVAIRVAHLCVACRCANRRKLGM